MRANFVMSSVSSGLRRNLSMTVALVLSSAIALAFVAAAFLANTEVNRFAKQFERRIHPSVYLCTNLAYETQVQARQNAAQDHKALPPLTCAKNEATSPQRRDEIRKMLEADPRVVSVTPLSSAQAIKNARELGIPGANTLKPGSLPDSFIIELRSLRSDYVPFEKKFSAVQGVDEVTNAYAQIKQVIDIIDGFRLFCVMIAGVVLVASVLMIANTIQVAAAQRQEETSIMRLVGASRLMTELPFMLETLISMLLGSFVAIGLVWIGKSYVLNHIFGFQVENGIIPNLTANDLLISGGIAAASGLALGAVTAFATLRLRVRL